MYEWIPPKNNKKAQNATLLLLGGAAALVLIFSVFPSLPFRWIPQLITVCLLTAAIFLMARYISKSYIYRIVSDENGGYDLTVTETKVGGRGPLTVCRVGLSHVRHRLLADPAHEAEIRAWVAERKRARNKIFDYCVDWRPDQSIWILVEEGGEELALRLAYDPSLFDLLTPHNDGQEET